MRVSWVLIYNWLGWVCILRILSGDMALVCPQRYNSRFASHQRTGIMHSSSKLLNGFWLTFTLGLPIIWRAIWQHLSHPRRTKAKVSSSPVTPLSISDIGRSLSLSFRSGNVLHLNDAMLVPSVSLSKNRIGWTTLWWSPKLSHLDSDFLCVRIYTRIMS